MKTDTFYLINSATNLLTLYIFFVFYSFDANAPVMLPELCAMSLVVSKADCAFGKSTVNCRSASLLLTVCALVYLLVLMRLPGVDS